MGKVPGCGVKNGRAFECGEGELRARDHRAGLAASVLRRLQLRQEARP